MQINLFKKKVNTIYSVNLIDYRNFLNCHSILNKKNKLGK